MPEIEIKFAVPDPARLEELAALARVGPYSVVGRREVEQSDTYYDTPSREAAAAGGSVRERRRDGGTLYTLKGCPSSDDVPRRDEVEEPADGRELREWVREVLASGRVSLRLEPDSLERVLEIRNRRTLLDLETDAGDAAEMALDRLTYVGPRGEAREREVELELKSGDPARLREAGRWLETERGLARSRTGKYRRALETVG
ncbi:MAG: CYTH domain-containing protein [Armatimonadota bacterium]